MNKETRAVAPGPLTTKALSPVWIDSLLGLLIGFAGYCAPHLGGALSRYRLACDAAGDHLIIEHQPSGSALARLAIRTRLAAAGTFHPVSARCIHGTRRPTGPS